MTSEERLLREAAIAARDTDDPNTAVGCIIHHPTRGVLARTANRLPPGVRSSPPERLERPAKYLWIEHAERAALLLAARNGIATAGASLYVYGGFPCAECARAIVAAGISEVVYSYGASAVSHWAESYEISRVMLEEGGVKTIGRPADSMLPDTPNAAE